jgi:hypothetical protein
MKNPALSREKAEGKRENLRIYAIKQKILPYALSLMPYPFSLVSFQFLEPVLRSPVDGACVDYCGNGVSP